MHIKIFLQGSYADTGTVSAVLVNQGVGTNPLVTDSIDVELRDQNPPYNMVATTRAKLKTDGNWKKMSIILCSQYIRKVNLSI